MTPITPDQLANARQLVAQRLPLLRMLVERQTQHTQAQQSTADARKRATERTNFRDHPERLAGLAECAQRNTAPIRRQLAQDYAWFLAEMFDPIAYHPGTPKPRPRQVDFHRLPGAARPYLLGPYLSIHPGGRFARLCLERSVPSRGRLVIIQSGGPIDADLWRGQLAAINSWLGGAWAVTEVTANTLTLIQRTPLAAVIPMRRELLQRDALFLGIDTETHRPVYLPFAEMTSGTFIVGAAGSGKSNAVHLLMQSIVANLPLFQAVFCVDGKEGMTFARYRNVAPDKLRILSDEADLWQLVRALVAVTRARNATLARLGLDKAPNNYIALVIEEMSTYTAKPAGDDKAAIKAHGQFIADLAALARKGRSAGLKILITAQDPTQEQVPTAVRANCQTSIIFRLGIDQHATTVLGGEIPPAHDPRKLTTGRALIKRDNGSLITVQFPAMPESGAAP